MSTFESTVVTTILQNAEKMTAKEAKWFRAGKTQSVIFFGHVQNMPSPHCWMAGAEAVCTVEIKESEIHFPIHYTIK